MIEKITKQSINAHNKLLHTFNKVDISVKLKILQQQKQKFHQIKTQYSDESNDVLTYCALIIAIAEFVSNTDETAINLSKLRVKQMRTRSQRNRIIALWAIIRMLKLQEHMSFRQISSYLRMYHKLKVAHSTLFNLWCELEKNEDNNKKDLSC